MTRHISTPEERARLKAAGWRRVDEDWWLPPHPGSGMGRTAREALRELGRLSGKAPRSLAVQPEE